MSSDDGGTQAEVKNVPLNAQTASAGAAADAAKKAAAPPSDLACKKACVDEPEISEDAVTTAKLAPGSVTLSKLAFEVPNLNELENEINARKAAEAAAALGREALASETAKNDAAITAAAQNGLTAEAAARTAAIDKLSTDLTAADADLLGKLNKEIADRTAGDDALQLNLNTEIAARQSALSTLRSELANGTQVDDAAVIVRINNNELVNGAVTSDKLFNETILSEDIKNGEVKTVDIADANVTTLKLKGTELADATQAAQVRAVTAGALADNAVIARTIAEKQIDATKLTDAFFASLATQTELDDAIDAEALARDNADTVLQTNINNEATARGAADTVLQTNINNEATARGAADTALQGEVDAVETDLSDLETALGSESATAGTAGPGNKKVPNASDALVEWSRLKGVPSGFADNIDDDGDAKVKVLADELSNSASSTKHEATPVANENTDPVSWFKIKDLKTGANGNITGEFLQDGSVGALDLAPNAVTFAKIEKGAVRGEVVGATTAGTNGNIALESINAANLAPDSVGVSELASDVDAIIQGLQDADAALGDRITALASPAAADTVHALNLTGIVVEAIATPGAPLTVTEGTKLGFALVVKDIRVGDFLSVSPPASLDAGLVFAGATITADDEVTVYVFNPAGSGDLDVLAADEWVVSWMDRTA